MRATLGEFSKDDPNAVNAIASLIRAPVFRARKLLSFFQFNDERVLATNARRIGQRSARILHANPPNLGAHALFHEENKGGIDADEAACARQVGLAVEVC